MATCLLFCYFAPRMQSFDATILNNKKEIKEIIHLIRYEIQHAQRPANEVILDDEDVMLKLKISKRKLQYLKADRVIPFHTLDYGSPRTYYLLSDILQLLNDNRIDSVANNCRIK
jgi:hypothetical protein